jgi:sterol 3beta-glucosyltransferase
MLQPAAAGSAVACALEPRMKPSPPSDAEISKSAAAFLARRMRRQQMRIAALRALKTVSARPDQRLALDFGDEPRILDEAAARLADEATGRARPTEPRREHLVIPRLNLLIMITGTRGDVQPFIPIGKRLAWRHRVRIAAHAEFRAVVENAGLEFFPLAGDPHALSAYMIKNRGSIVPTNLRLFVADVPRTRQMIAEILASTWRACTEADPDRAGAEPFVADAIISNPPTYGHLHCAEALRIPLHLVWTMPWTPTRAFPHPFTHVPPGSHDPVRNWLSYEIMDLLMWVGVADLVNEFRERTLRLPPIELGAATRLADLEVPMTYLFPDSLIPKPAEWGPHIDLANFVFFDQGQTSTPSPDLTAFLAAGERPIYVGFGSSVVQDPEATTRTIYAALERAGLRAVVLRGWGSLGGDSPPPHVHLIDDCPHDWLFPRCRAACHHGGAGTTSASLRAGLPTLIVPFFGDQHFWGQVVYDAGAGPVPIPIERLSVDALAEAFTACRDPRMQARAEELGAKIRNIDGVEMVVDSLRRHLPITAMQCARDPNHLARVYCTRCALRLCAACHDLDHAGHPVQPYSYVDWAVRQPEHIGSELKAVVADALHALRTVVDSRR